MLSNSFNEKVYKNKIGGYFNKLRQEELENEALEVLAGMGGVENESLFDPDDFAFSPYNEDASYNPDEDLYNPNEEEINPFKIFRTFRYSNGKIKLVNIVTDEIINPIGGYDGMDYTQDISKFKDLVYKIKNTIKQSVNKSTKPAQSTQPTTPTQPSTSVEITKSNYTRQEVQNNPDTAYVFTENTHSITAFPNRSGGGSAVIRPEPNAFAIVTKKKYDYNTRENVDYSDTEADFKEFTEVNTRLINELKNSGKSKIKFPQGFATDKAKMPTRFAEWLQKALLDNFGLVTELNSTKTGLISKSTQPSTSVSTEADTFYNLKEFSDEEKFTILDNIILKGTATTEDNAIDQLNDMLISDREFAIEFMKSCLT
jgi:hypothetical protein